MSTVTYVRVRCNKCGDESNTDFITWQKPREVRANAKAQGWKLGKQKDYCPSCSADINEQIRKIREGT